ncbi:MAG: stage 0 sporulation family protein [Anaerolineae bacterium]|jgi:cell fate regulator YaaT (PSP1 superfamily)
MPLVIGVRFNPAGKVYYFDPAGIENIRVNEYIVVETSRGEEVGRVVIPPRDVDDDEIVRRLKAAKRRATALDLTQMSFYGYKEQAALQRCQEKAQEHGLPMKIVRAEYNYDGSRLVFFFAAEQRVDFRKLVHDLARSFRARIELRQIGVRDEAKLMGGVGRCGLALCCATWLTEFSPVSIKMAKLQDLPLSPMDISGVCGRLLCCLAYESDDYAEMKAKLPKAGKYIDTPHGRGKVVQVNVVKESVQVELESQISVEVTRQELAEMDKKPPVEPKRRRRRRKRKN